DAYYQEIGRAGRDDRAAHARLLYRPEDFGAAVHLASHGVSRSTVAGVAELLASGSDAGMTRGATAGPVRLVDVGAAVWDAGGEVRWTGALSVGRGCSIRGGDGARERGRALATRDDAPLCRAHGLPPLLPAVVLRSELRRAVRELRQRPHRVDRDAERRAVRGR